MERDYRNRSLGKAGDRSLSISNAANSRRPTGRILLKICWVSVEDGDGAGYDILSFDRSGSPRLIEVKTTNGSARTPFFLSRNERNLADERPTNWRIYRVHLFATEPHIFTIAPPLETSVYLRPETWRASF